MELTGGRARRRAGATANAFRPLCPVNVLFGGGGPERLFG
jgi:hypothetical protein